MFPLNKIKISYDAFNSSVNQNYYLIGFVKNNHILKIGFITKTMCKINKLEDQLNNLFGGENA